MHRLLGIIIVLLLVSCQQQSPQRVTEVRLLMGTAVQIDIDAVSEDKARDAMVAAYTEMQRLSSMMSHYEPDSVVSAINAKAGVAPVPVPHELMQVLQQAQRVSQRTGGAFDITIGSIRGWRFDPQQPGKPEPKVLLQQRQLVDYRRLQLDTSAGTAMLTHKGMALDTGGIAKLYILDAGMAVLRRAGLRRAMINGGGDIIVMAPASTAPWRIGLRDPRNPDGLLASLAQHNAYIVSSGDYERYFDEPGRRYHHILNPATGEPTRGPRGVTLVAQTLEAVNGMSAAVMVLGEQAGHRLIERDPQLQGLIVSREGGLWVSPRLRSQLDLPPPAAE